VFKIPISSQVKACLALENTQLKELEDIYQTPLGVRKIGILLPMKRQIMVL